MNYQQENKTSLMIMERNEENNEFEMEAKLKLPENDY